MFDQLKTYIERLVVLQTKAQSLHYKNSRRAEGDLVLPIGPEAMYETQINDWEFCSLGDLWTHEQLNTEKEIGQKSLDDLINTLNEYSRRWKPDLGLEIGNYYSFQLWVVIGQIRHNDFIVRCVAENLNPKKVLCYTKANPETFMEHRPDPDGIFADALGRSRLHVEGRCEIIKIDEQTKINSRREKVLSYLPVPIRTLLRRLRDRNVLRNNNSTTYNLLLIGGQGDWLKLSSDIAFSKVFRLHVPPELKSVGRVDPPRQLIEILHASIQRDEPILYDISDLAAAIQTDLAFFANQARSIDVTLKKYAAVVTAVLSFPRDSFLAHRAALAGLPVIVWQHGEKGQSGFDSLNVYTELFYATDYFAYAPLVVDLYKPWIGKYRLNNVVAVGSIEKRVEWQGGNSIVYATGKWFKTTFSGDPDTRLFLAHTKILDYLDYLESQGDQYSIVFKANNTPGLNGIPYKYDKIKIEYERPFVECLKTAKLIILDTPATTLVEACSTNVPIFVLGGRIEYTKEFLDSVRRRVVWSDTPGELINRVAAFLQSGVYEASVEDKTFLPKYGCGEQPTRVAESVRIAVTDSIIRAQNRQGYTSYGTSSL